MDPNTIISEHYKRLIEINKEEKDKNQEKKDLSFRNIKIFS